MALFRLFFITILVVAYLSMCVAATEGDNPLRLEKREPGIWDFFKNAFSSSCSSTKGESGTCVGTKEDCNNQQGEVDGSCGTVFRSGVCCVPKNTCGTTVNGNGTVFTNKEFPSPVFGMDDCQIIIKKMDDSISQIRFDFIEFSLGEPSATSLCENDKFIVTETAQALPILCGNNDGQHLYANFRDNSDRMIVNIATADTATVTRKWQIKVTQYKRDSVYKALDTCQQYFTNLKGVFKSFNSQSSESLHQIGNHHYNICFRSVNDYCGISFKKHGPFSMTGDAATPTAATGAECTTDYLHFIFEDKDGLPGANEYCGSEFEGFSTYAQPFMVRVRTDDNEPETDLNNVGFDLEYELLHC